jgi:Na+/melibiose symporter-like transporter
MQMIGILAVAVTCIPIIIVRDLIGAIISFAFLGFAVGAITFIKYPIFSDMIDEATMLDGKHQEGLYQGVFVFFDRLGIILQPIIFTVIHIMTKFDPESESQTFIAQQGILAAMLWIPALIMLIACLIFWKIYDLTPEKADTIKKKLKEQKL